MDQISIDDHTKRHRKIWAAAVTNYPGLGLSDPGADIARTMPPSITCFPIQFLASDLPYSNVLLTCRAEHVLNWITTDNHVCDEMRKGHDYP
jgi:hypothetical protein